MKILGQRSGRAVFNRSLRGYEREYAIAGDSAICAPACIYGAICFNVHRALEAVVQVAGGEWAKVLVVGEQKSNFIS